MAHLLHLSAVRPGATENNWEAAHKGWSIIKVDIRTVASEPLLKKPVFKDASNGLKLLSRDVDLEPPALVPGGGLWIPYGHHCKAIVYMIFNFIPMPFNIIWCIVRNAGRGCTYHTYNSFFVIYHKYSSREQYGIACLSASFQTPADRCIEAHWGTHHPTPTT